MAAKQKGRSAQALKLNGLFMGLLNSLSIKNKSKAKAVRKETGIAQAIGWVRHLRAEQANARKAKETKKAA